MYYLNPNQMKPNCYTYCISNTKVSIKNYLASKFEFIFKIILQNAQILNYMLIKSIILPNICVVPICHL